MGGVRLPRDPAKSRQPYGGASPHTTRPAAQGEPLTHTQRHRPSLKPPLPCSPVLGSAVYHSAFCPQSWPLSPSLRPRRPRSMNNPSPAYSWAPALCLDQPQLSPKFSPIPGPQAHHAKPSSTSVYLPALPNVPKLSPVAAAQPPL